MPKRVTNFLVNLNSILVSLWDFDSKLMCSFVVMFVQGCGNPLSALEG
jgi:hypothetical protein